MRHDETRENRIGTEDLIDPGHAGAHETEATPRTTPEASASELTGNKADDTFGESRTTANAWTRRGAAPADDEGTLDGDRSDAVTGDRAAAFSGDRSGALSDDRSDALPGDGSGASAGDREGAVPDDREGATTHDREGATPDDREGATPRGHRGAAPGDREEEHAKLFEDEDSNRFRDRWHDVQSAFVDDPKRAVQDADQLVAELMQTLAATFAQRKQSLEGQWQKGGDAETEDLRLALRSYRSFFDQLLPH